MKKLYVAIGIDCDPDRDTYPEFLTFKGLDSVYFLRDISDVKWTFNIRCDTQIRDYFGISEYCYNAYRSILDVFENSGSQIALHLHYYDKDGFQDVSEGNIIENVDVSGRLNKNTVHMGWTFQNDFSLQQLYNSGIRIDYSPLPGMKYSGRNGSDFYDWNDFLYRPMIRKKIKMIPTYTYRDRILCRRFGTERVMLTTCTAPFLYNRLLKSFFSTGSDFFVTYFHVDEIISALPDWRKILYSLNNLKRNIETIKRMAKHHGFEPEFVTIEELAKVLF